MAFSRPLRAARTGTLGGVRRRERRGVAPRVGYRGQLRLMLAPYLLGLVVLTVLPALAALPLALTAYDAIRAPSFLGLANFAELAGDRTFRLAVFNSLAYVALAVPLRLLGALGLALLLARPARGAGAARAAVYLPTTVPDVVWALLWLWLLNPLHGPVNPLLGAVGLPQPAWLIGEWNTRFALVLMGFWQLGEGLVVCLAGLREVPAEVREQAATDGGSAVQTFRHVTLPLLAPTLLVLLCRDTVVGLGATFVPALLVGAGTSLDRPTTFLPTYVYVAAFDHMRLGYAAAMTWALYALTAGVVWVQVRGMRGRADIPHGE